jgi:hypothetical protein
MNNQIKTLILAMSILLLCEQGYCLFPDQIDSHQVISAVKFQRAKDKNRKNQAQQEKDKEKFEQLIEQPMPGNDSYAPAENKKKGITQQSIEKKAQQQKAVVQYKRFTRDGQVVATPAPIPVDQPVTVEEEKKSNQGWIALLAVLGIGAVIIYKNKKE